MAPTSAATTAVSGCQETYTETQNVHALGGSEFAAATMADQCRHRCNSLPNCVGFDYNTSPASTIRCFILSTDAQKTSVVNGPRINHYVKDNKCGGQTGCLDPYTNHTRTGSHNGEENRASNTFDLCLAYCRTTSDCLAFDFDTAGNVKCYIHRNKVYLQRTFAQGVSVTQYRMTRNCNVVSSTSVVPSSTTTSRPSGTPEPGCRMDERNNRQLGGGTPIGIMTIHQCEDHCLTDRTCRASEYNRVTQQCYKFTVYSVGGFDPCCVRFQKSCTGN